MKKILVLGALSLFGLSGEAEALIATYDGAETWSIPPSGEIPDQAQGQVGLFVSIDSLDENGALRAVNSMRTLHIGSLDIEGSSCTPRVLEALGELIHNNPECVHYLNLNGRGISPVDCALLFEKIKHSDVVVDIKLKEISPEFMSEFKGRRDEVSAKLDEIKRKQLQIVDIEEQIASSPAKKGVLRTQAAEMEKEKGKLYTEIDEISDSLRERARRLMGRAQG